MLASSLHANARSPCAAMNSARCLLRAGASAGPTLCSSTSRASGLPLGLRTASTSSVPGRKKTALFFPGHGVQRVGMAEDWVAAFPGTCNPFLEEMDSILGTPLSKLIASGLNAELDRTENSQPAIMAVSIMVLRVLEQEFGFDTDKVIDVTLGHSLGEFASITAAGHIDYADTLRIVRRRGEAMARSTREASQARGGADLGMIALVCEPEKLKDMTDMVLQFTSGRPNEDSESGTYHNTEDGHSHRPPIDQVSIANKNSRNQIVLSGSISRIQEVLTQIRQFGGHDPRAVRLRSDSPFHSPMMLPAKMTMIDLLEKTKINFPGRFPCISNVSALPFDSAANIRDLLARQCVDTVKWWDSIKYVDQELGVSRWIGLGPGKVGRNLVGKEVGMKGRHGPRGGGVWGISKPNEIEPLLRGLEESENLQEEDVESQEPAPKPRRRPMPEL